MRLLQYLKGRHDKSTEYPKRNAQSLSAGEDKNNNYFQALKNSGIWETCCGNETYAKIREHSGFDIKQWIEDYIDWSSDFRIDTIQYFKDNNLDQYLKW